MKNIGIVMAGGKGERLKLISGSGLPKQFLPLLSDKPMLFETIDRVSPIFSPGRIFICTVEEYIHKVANSEYEVISEPKRRGTSYSVLLLILEIMERYGDAVIHLIPSDHFIQGVSDFQKDLIIAGEIADKKDKILLIGVKPNEPYEHYGYVKDMGNEDIRFFEKPSKDQAIELIESGYRWNTGIFVFKASIMYRECLKHMPDIVREFEKAYSAGELLSFYEEAAPINIEKSVIEKTDKLYLLSGHFEWSDIGTIKQLFKVWEGDGMRYGKKIKTYTRANKGSRKSD